MSTFHIVEAIHGASKKPRTKQQWEELSESNTQKITQLGSNAPLAWVLVRDKNFPPNAIVAGEDMRRPLYIARTFYEGGVHIGQAGQHIDQGASFAYLGKQIFTDTFEVLVPLQQSLTYRVSDSYSLPYIPRISRSNEVPVDSVLLQKLRSAKIVMVIDDSRSMVGTLWSQARSALIGLASLIESDPDAHGIDLCFLNNPTFEVNIRDRRRVQSLFDSVFPNGGTPTGRKLQEVFARYLPALEDPIKRNNTLPIVTMAITAGSPSDDLAGVIIGGARRLNQSKVPLRRFSLSFIQIGSNPDTTEFLKELKDDISGENGCRDIVNTTPFNSKTLEFTREVLLKCILGSIDSYYDSTQYLLSIDTAVLQKKLHSIKIVMVVDDSMSMVGTLWSQARLALMGLVSLIESDFNAHGIDLCFLNNPAFEANIRGRRRVQNIFDSVHPDGETPTGRKLQEVFARYLPTLEDPINGNNTPPIVAMVITDGVPTDDLTKVIIDGARRLDQSKIPLRRFGISFIQIGSDPDAAEYLRELDDDISSKHGCRDIVDATPFDSGTPEFTREAFLKCILGSIDPYYNATQHVDEVSQPLLSPYTTSLKTASLKASSTHTLLMPSTPMSSMPTPFTN